MADLNDEAIFTAAKGFVFVGAVGTATAPTVTEISDFDPDAPALGAGWSLIGHTSDDELPEFGFDGGDTEVRGSWQVEALKTVQTEALIDYVTMTLLQFDDTAFELYYGAPNAEGAAEGEFVVNTTDTQGADRALCIVMVDGTEFRIGFYSPKSNIRREESISLDTDAFAGLPIRATFLKETGQPLYKWIAGHLNPAESV